MGFHGRNPCVSCGACCANFRVQFYWREANPGQSDHPVPAHLFEELDDRYRCMKGTNNKHHPKCQGLKGRIGVNASCSIYEFRPTPCREFKASFSDGKRYERCDQARARHGLKPLQLKDWISDPNPNGESVAIVDLHWPLGPDREGAS